MSLCIKTKMKKMEINTESSIFFDSSEEDKLCDYRINENLNTLIVHLSHLLNDFSYTIDQVLVFRIEFIQNQFEIRK